MKWNYFFRGWNVNMWSWNDITSLRRKWRSLCTPCILTGRRIWFASRHRSITRWVDYYRLWYHGVHTLHDSTIDEHIVAMYFLPIVLRTTTVWYTYQVNLLVYMLYVFIVCMLIPAGGNSQTWLTQLSLVWRHQAVTWTNFYLLSVESCAIHLRIIWQELLEISIINLRLNINSLRRQPHLLAVNQLNYIMVSRWYISDC